MAERVKVREITNDDGNGCWGSCVVRCHVRRSHRMPFALGRPPRSARCGWISSRRMPNFAEVALERMETIVGGLLDVERTNNPPGCYFLVRRKIFAQVATGVEHPGRLVTMVALRPDPGERDSLLSIGHPYFSRGSWDDRLGRSLS